MTAVAMARDPANRVAVVLSGDVLVIEYRDRAEKQRIELAPRQVEWEEPQNAFTGQ